MVRPAALYNKARFSRDIASLGRVVAVLCGNPRIRREDLTDDELSSLEEVENESEEMDKAVEAQRERWREKKRKARTSPDVSGTNGDTHVSPDVPNLPTNQPTYQPTKNTIRSVPVQARARARTVDGGASKTERNGNGTDSMRMEAMPGGLGEAARRARAFAEAAKADAGAFFDAQFDPVTVCAAVTGDFGSLKRWRQLVAAKGEGAVREEAFAFWREVASGEDVGNRGAALNARLARLQDEGGTAR